VHFIPNNFLGVPKFEIKNYQILPISSIFTGNIYPELRNYLENPPQTIYYFTIGLSSNFA